LIKDNIDEVTDKKMMALNKFEKDKIMVAKAYNKEVLNHFKLEI
jgi:phosphohistidine swiveling domain-containing protein